MATCKTPQKFLYTHSMFFSCDMIYPVYEGGIYACRILGHGTVGMDPYVYNFLVPGGAFAGLLKPSAWHIQSNLGITNQSYCQFAIAATALLVSYVMLSAPLWACLVCAWGNLTCGKVRDTVINKTGLF